MGVIRHIYTQSHDNAEGLIRAGWHIYAVRALAGGVEYDLFREEDE